MKKKLCQMLLIGAITLAFPLPVNATDVEPQPAEETSVETQEEAEEGESSEENPEEEPTPTPETVTRIVEVSNDIIPYQKGDRPFILYEDNVCISYNVIHGDGTVSSMSEGEFATWYERYVAKTGDEEPHFGQMYDFMEERKRVTLENSRSEEEAAVKLAIHIDTLGGMPPKDDVRWKFIEIDGVKHYVFVNIGDGKYYEVNEELYNHYIQEDRNWVEDNIVIDNGTVGFGTVLFTLNLSERIQNETLVITLYDYYEDETKSVLVGPPYSSALSLEKGKYRIEDICLYDSIDTSLEYDKPEFTVEEHKTTSIILDVTGELDAINIAPVTEEQMAAINQDYIDTHPETGETAQDIAATDVPSALPREEVPKKSNKTLIVIIVSGLAAVGIIAGAIIYRKKQYEY